jgi:BMFP domain-containing protein YqiC
VTLRFAKTDAALDRLDKAISRLEKAVTEAPPPAAPSPKTSTMPDLFGSDELNRTRQDYAKLDQASRHVEARLDTLADRLQTILDS